MQPFSPRIHAIIYQLQHPLHEEVWDMKREKGQPLSENGVRRIHQETEEAEQTTPLRQ
jgi:hypothetical protein